jgi:predicted enzyme related to lactoylglutathione lyase
MKKDTFAPGEPCWIDCGTDLTKGPQFYADLFGWTIQGLGEEAGGYSMAIKGDVEVAGFGPQQNPGTPMWSVYFHTDDATKTAELVTSNGGTVLFAPMQVMEAGHLAIFADPQGAAFSVWQPNQHRGFGEVNEPGTYCWAELTTPELDAAKRFYGSVFGLTAKASDDETMAYVELQRDGTSIGGMMQPPETAPADLPPFWGVYFAVEDADATVAKAEALGGATIVPATDIAPGRFAVMTDSLGACFNVIALATT